MTTEDEILTAARNAMREIVYDDEPASATQYFEAGKVLIQCGLDLQKLELEMVKRH